MKVRNAANNELENAARQLFQTVKDHNNRSIQDMLDISNYVYCYRNAHDSSTDEENDEVEYATLKNSIRHTSRACPVV